MNEEQRKVMNEFKAYVDEQRATAHSMITEAIHKYFGDDEEANDFARWKIASFNDTLSTIINAAADTYSVIINVNVDEDLVPKASMLGAVAMMYEIKKYMDILPSMLTEVSLSSDKKFIDELRLDVKNIAYFRGHQAGYRDAFERLLERIG